MKDDNGRCMRNIETLCKWRNITVKELEEELQLGDGYLKRRKKANKTPNAEDLFAIAKRLGVTADALVRA